MDTTLAHVPARRLSIASAEAYERRIAQLEESLAAEREASPWRIATMALRHTMAAVARALGIPDNGDVLEGIRKLVAERDRLLEDNRSLALCLRDEMARRRPAAGVTA